MKKKSLYEQPMNEHVRTLLRLEHLFEGITYHLKGASTPDSRAVVNLLIETIDCTGRIDLKTELLKRLTQYAQGLEKWQDTPDADAERVTKFIMKIETVLENLKARDGQIGENLTQHQLINSVKQRVNIPGGTCHADLPLYHHWLQKNPKQRQNELSDWLSSLEPLRDAANLELYLLRNNTVTSQETAINGLYQSTLEEELDYQIIQVTLPLDHPCYPEISAGKHRLTIRFFEQHNPWERPSQTEQDINFELRHCLG
jgi:cell division protein ZapD